MAKHPFQNFLVRFSVGERIFNEGDRGMTMYIVQSGRVRLFRDIDGETRVQGEMEKGDFFGEMSILEGLPRNTSAEAIDETELIEINSTTFDKMIKGNIEIAIRLLRKLSIKLRAAEQKIEELMVAGPVAPVPSVAPVARSAQPSRGITEGLRLVAPDDGVAYALNEPETLIGRYDPVTELKPDVDLTDLDLKRSVSRRHARIVKNGSGFSVVEEVGALNGTFVNGTKLETGKAHPLRDGDELALGMVKLFFHV